MTLKKTVRLALTKETPPLAGKVAYITLKNHSIDEGRHCVTPDCASFGELDKWINHIIEELEVLRAEGRKFFTR